MLGGDELKYNTFLESFDVFSVVLRLLKRPRSFRFVSLIVQYSKSCSNNSFVVRISREGGNAFCKAESESYRVVCVA